MPELGYLVAAELSRLSDRLGRVTVELAAGSESRGSGLVWREDGLIVTNAHVALTDRLTVRLRDGRQGPARVLARSRRDDLALLQAPWRGLLTPTLGDPAGLSPGELVVALGAPLGVSQSLAVGVVHRAPDPAHGMILEVDLALLPGNSGGPLADSRGAVVGINTAVVGGVGVAVPVDRVGRMVRWLDRQRRAAA